MTFRLFLSLLFLHQSSAWVSLPSPTSQRNSLALQATSRQDFCKSAALAVVSAALAMPPSSALADATPGDKALPNGVSYTVIKKGKGPKPERGELVALRFVAYNGGVNDLKIDDIFDSPEPYYTRIGSGALIKGVEETLPLMQLGDRWRLTIPVSSTLWSQDSKLSYTKL